MGVSLTNPRALHAARPPMPAKLLQILGKRVGPAPSLGRESASFHRPPEVQSQHFAVQNQHALLQPLGQPSISPPSQVQPHERRLVVFARRCGVCGRMPPVSGCAPFGPKSRALGLLFGVISWAWPLAEWLSSTI